MHDKAESMLQQVSHFQKTNTVPPPWIENLDVFHITLDSQGLILLPHSHPFLPKL